MLADKEAAITSNSALGCTFGSTAHHITVDGAPYTFWDTAGLNEGDEGSVPGQQAMQNLRELIRGLEDGVSLLVYCIRGARYRDIIKVNYDLFTKIICQSTVPVVVAVTGLENESCMEDWWIENEKEFTSRGVRFTGHACITSYKGKKTSSGGYLFEEEYEESKVVLRQLIKDHCPRTAWAVDSQLWLTHIANTMKEYYEEYNENVEGDGGLAARARHGGGRNGRDPLKSMLRDLMLSIISFLD